MTLHLPGLPRAGVAVLAASLLALASCSSDADPDANGDQDPADVEQTNDAEDEGNGEPAELELDLEAAGGICALIDPELLTSATGVEFTSASGFYDGGEDIGSCAVQTNVGTFPDLTLALAAAEVSPETFEDEMVSDAEELDDLGDAAFELFLSGGDTSGPALEIGWLSDGYVFEMRYTSAEGTELDDLEDSSADLLELAQAIDAAWEDWEPTDESEELEEEDD
ncbi:hypothetical protein [Natronoglycomyces albus]|uniref:DUF3558 domain-containing protein n=1 Tax=Natronoglycomyces albus TaxID=2811108 RepID=A0A895XST3_9ACTN|nr:hypothetical protein [Natronoglycomyces albus]QSB06379.1 hypothetical protein JQS30_05565 [Natronoglycomyces albus]